MIQFLFLLPANASPSRRWSSSLYIQIQRNFYQKRKMSQYDNIQKQRYSWLHYISYAIQQFTELKMRGFPNDYFQGSSQPKNAKKQ